MKIYTVSELNEILRKHELWIKGDPSGSRANLSCADLSDADLSGAYLSCANLSCANLSGANLSCANLSGVNLSDANLSCADLSDADLSGAYLSDANLSCADLSDADLSGAYLSCANLSCANLSGANLSCANLSGVNLSGANLSRTNLFGADLSGADLSDAKNINYPIACPEKGSFTAFKKVRNDYIVELEIPADALRSSATSRKCRCSHAKVVSITNFDGTAANIGTVFSNYDMEFGYRVGEVVKVNNFDTNRWNECAPGIHFFITRQEAIDYMG